MTATAQPRLSLASLVFGYDIFVSYRREDAQGYAEALTRRLRESGLTCFLDKDETVGGVELSPAIKRALRKSRLLICVLTPGVLSSDWVQQEVAAFLHTKDRLIPINVDRFLESDR